MNFISDHILKKSTCSLAPDRDDRFDHPNESHFQKSSKVLTAAFGMVALTAG
ncbi:hypothetical protein [Enterococcus mundtii]|uniref:hypothetical protein n=1 Tax=Enterococcus mundtii TaxID=53346 RepID=UPI0035C76B03